MDLPTKKDWNNWNQIEKKVVMIMYDHPIINILPILIILDNWINYTRPPSRSEIQVALYEKNLEGNNWWQLLIPPQPVMELTGKNKIRKTAELNDIKVNKKNEKSKLIPSKSSDHRLYQILEERGLITSQSFKENKNKNTKANVDSTFHIAPTILNLHGRERVYSITPIGKIYLNIILQKPWLAISLNRFATNRGFLTISTMSWMYLKKQKSYPDDFKKSINEILKKNEVSTFWKMDSSTTRIISEYNSLLRFKKKNLKIIDKNKDITERLTQISTRQNSNYQAPFFPEKFIAKEMCLLIDSFLNIIETKAQEEGLSKDDLEEQVKIIADLEL